MKYESETPNINRPLFQPMYKLSSFIVLLVCAIAFAAPEQKFFDARFTLKTQGKYSQFPGSVYASNPNYYTSWSAIKDDAYTAGFVTDDHIVVGYESYSGLPGGNTTWFLTLDTSSGTPTETSRVPAPLGVASQVNVENSFADGSGVIGIASGWGFNGTLTCPICNGFMRQYVYLGDRNGTFNQTPALIYDFLSLGDPFYYTTTIAYGGTTAVSTDGNYATFSYPTWSAHPFAISREKLGVFKIDTQGGPILTPVVVVPYPVNPRSGYTYTPFLTRMQPLEDGKYLISIAADSYAINLLAGVFDVLNTPSAVFLYIFDENDNSLTLIGNVSQPTIVRGVVMDKQSSMMVSFTNAVGTPTVLLSPAQPELTGTSASFHGMFMNMMNSKHTNPKYLNAFAHAKKSVFHQDVSLVDSPNSNVRMYSIDTECHGHGCNGCNGLECNALKFVSGTQVDGARCWNGAFSSDGSLLAYLCQPGSTLLATVPNVVPNPISGPNTQISLLGVITLVSVDRQMSVRMSNWLTTSIIPVAISFSPDNTKVVSVGSDNTIVAGVDQYEVERNY